VCPNRLANMLACHDIWADVCLIKEGIYTNSNLAYKGIKESAGFGEGRKHDVRTYKSHWRRGFFIQHRCITSGRQGLELSITGQRPKSPLGLEGNVLWRPGIGV
jgi:hypothetical protein